MDEIAENEPLMAAIGRIALRSAELGETIDAIAGKLDPRARLKCKGLMLGKKIELTKQIVERELASYPELVNQFRSFCNHVFSLLNDRNSPLHSTFLADDDEGARFIKWDSKIGPEVVSIADLNASAKAFEGATRKCLEYFLEVRDFKIFGAPTGRLGGPSA